MKQNMNLGIFKIQILNLIKEIIIYIITKINIKIKKKKIYKEN